MPTMTMPFRVHYFASSHAAYYGKNTMPHVLAALEYENGLRPSPGNGLIHGSPLPKAQDGLCIRSGRFSRRAVEFGVLDHDTHYQGTSPVILTTRIFRSISRIDACRIFSIVSARRYFHSMPDLKFSKHGMISLTCSSVAHSHWPVKWRASLCLESSRLVNCLVQPYQSNFRRGDSRWCSFTLAGSWLPLVGLFPPYRTFAMFPFISVFPPIERCDGVVSFDRPFPMSNTISCRSDVTLYDSLVLPQTKCHASAPRQNQRRFRIMARAGAF